MDTYVLIPGAVGGLGKAFAAECAWQGWNLFLTDLQKNALATLAEGLKRQFNVSISFHPCDLSDPRSRAALWQEIEERNLRFHMLINVAGIEYEGTFIERSLDELHAILRLNIENAVEMMHRVLRFRDPQQRLYILNISSLASFFPMPMKAVYAASKRFLLDISLALHEELRNENIVVTALCPGAVPTNPHTIRRLNVQGLFGQLSLMNAGDVAAIAIEQTLQGKRMIVPGIFNQMLQRLALLLPPALLAAFIERRWRRARKRQ